MEDALLNRNRRNFVAIAVALLLVNVLGWQFPDSVSLLGNDFKTSPEWVRRLAWILFVYWGYEYAMCFVQQIGWWRSTWRDQLMRVLRNHPVLLSQIDSETVTDQLNVGDKRREFQELSLTYDCRPQDKKMRLHASVLMVNPKPDPPQRSSFGVGDIVVHKSDIRAARFVATVRVMLINPIAFNLWLPWAIALAAIIAELSRFLGFAAIGDSQAIMPTFWY